VDRQSLPVISTGYAVEGKWNMTYAIMPSRQVFLALTIIDDDAMLARPILPVTSLFFLVLTLYQQWLGVWELARAILDLAHALSCAAVPFWYLGIILAKSVVFGLGMRL
jgi:hypothetical protein